MAPEGLSYGDTFWAVPPKCGGERKDAEEPAWRAKCRPISGAFGAGTMASTATALDKRGCARLWRSGRLEVANTGEESEKIRRSAGRQTEVVGRSGFPMCATSRGSGSTSRRQTVRCCPAVAVHGQVQARSGLPDRKSVV